MSLDVYLIIPGLELRSTEPRIIVREDGGTREISRAEWDEKHPGLEPLTITNDEPSSEVYEANITHNLNKMAQEAGIYTALWRPSELLDPEKASQIREQEKVGNYHKAGGVFEIEQSLPQAHGRDLIEVLTEGLIRLKDEPERFKIFNPSNGWGKYEGLVEFTERYLAACKEWPDAEIRVSR